MATLEYNLEGGDDVLRGRDAAKGVVALELSLALEEGRRVAGVGNRLLDVGDLE
ncbi:hypothetical protein ACQP1P_35435 [Dactylosporangium sp. CA-052675]|uniref:hypothetical protein n=1 Tax=Dactylosporangium sp. CA-052675 TaxID=3239927 RepID=UPI003D89C72C